MGTLYGESLEMSLKRKAAQLSHLPKVAINYQKQKTCDYMGKNLHNSFAIPIYFGNYANTIPYREMSTLLAVVMKTHLADWQSETDSCIRRSLVRPDCVANYWLLGAYAHAFFGYSVRSNT